MKRLVPVFLILGTLFAVFACGGDKPSGPTSTGKAFKEGWSESVVVQENLSCRNRLAGDPTADRFCQCLFDKLSLQITLTDWQSLKTGSPAEAIVNQATTDCSN